MNIYFQEITKTQKQIYWVIVLLAIVCDVIYYWYTFDAMRKGVDSPFSIQYRRTVLTITTGLGVIAFLILQLDSQEVIVEEGRIRYRRTPFTRGYKTIQKDDIKAIENHKKGYSIHSKKGKRVLLHIKDGERFKEALTKI